MIRAVRYVAILGLTMSAGWLAVTTTAAPTERLLQMTIYNDIGVKAQNDGKSTYTDYGWNPTGQSDICVYGTAAPTGLAYVRLNRRQGFEDNRWCNQHLDEQAANLPDRSYTLVISDAQACTSLGLISPCSVVPSRTPRDGGFQPHVRVPTLFKSSAKKSLVMFQFELEGRFDQYSVDTDTEVTITTYSADHKGLFYAGKASFHGPSGKIGQSFPLPFHIEFTRQ